MRDPSLEVVPTVTGLAQPTTFAFLGVDDFLVCEKASGRVQHVRNGATVGTALDLAVNSASERGLLGITLHPDFPVNPGVYIFWSESTTGADSAVLAEIGLMGNRVDQFNWDGQSLTFVRNIMQIRAFQADTGQPVRGNHDGGVIKFGPDRKLYVMVGDLGRRGWMQNNLAGPSPDDQFGGPFPDDAHASGVIFRVNDDGTAPVDNPFRVLNISSAMNKVWMYGVRNGFGLAFDPRTGYLWSQENSDDAFDEMNRVTRGMNGGWIQFMGPMSRVTQYRDIEIASGGMQQLRWPPLRIALNPPLGYRRLYHAPMSQYRDPEFSWKFAVAPAGIGFVNTAALGPDFDGTLLVGAARLNLANGYLMRFKFNAERNAFAFDDPALNDKVADNAAKFDPAESTSLIVGENFGVGTDIQTSPDGRVFVVSLSDGAVYEIRKR